MDKSSVLYQELDRRWKATCRAIFGREVGDMEGYSAWLSEGLEPASKTNSIVSGKETSAIGDYCKGARFISFDEIDYSKKAAPIDVNRIKDIDSIIEAVREQAIYCGNIVLGNSSFVENSTGLEDCNYCLNAHTNHSSQYLAYFSLGRADRSLFGCSGCGESQFCIKMEECWKASRCVGTNRVWESSGVYLSHNLRGCSDCMFTFNQLGKRNLIGNVQLAPEGYAELKTKLVAELADELERKKRLPHLLDFVPPGVPKNVPAKRAAAHTPNEPRTDIKPVEEAFTETCRLLFGKPVGDLHSLGAYLSKHVRSVKSVPSCITRENVYYFPMEYDKKLAKTGRMFRLVEMDAVSIIREWPDKPAMEELILANIASLVSPIAYFCPEIEIQSSNMSECTCIQGAHDGFRASRVYFTKFTAYSFWPRDSDHVFGCDSMRNSSFCINCYNSYKLTRCFEADTSQNCSGSYFIHNCENVHDSMFCFNAKNLKHAIGNVEIGQEKYLAIKRLVLNEIAKKVEKEKKLDIDIYNLPSWQKIINSHKQ